MKKEKLNYFIVASFVLMINSIALAFFTFSNQTEEIPSQQDEKTEILSENLGDHL